MSIIDDLVSNLAERHSITLNGAFTIALKDGGLTVKGQIFSVLRDQKKNRDVVKINAPVDADVRVANIIVPLAQKG